MQSRHEEIKVKARLLLEKAQRESFDLKNIQPCDEDNHPQQQQPQQSVDNTPTAAIQSSVSAGKLCVCVLYLLLVAVSLC